MQDKERGQAIEINFPSKANPVQLTSHCTNPKVYIIFHLIKELLLTQHTTGRWMISWMIRSHWWLYSRRRHKSLPYGLPDTRDYPLSSTASFRNHQFQAPLSMTQDYDAHCRVPSLKTPMNSRRYNNNPQHQSVSSRYKPSYVGVSSSDLHQYQSSPYSSRSVLLSFIINDSNSMSNAGSSALEMFLEIFC